MPPAAPLPAPAPPAAARTAFQFVGGNGATLLEANWSVAHDSPLVESLVFLPWTVHAAPNRAVVGRSAVVAAILMATRPPAEDQRDAARLDFLDFWRFPDADGCIHSGNLRNRRRFLILTKKSEAKSPANF